MNENINAIDQNIQNNLEYYQAERANAKKRRKCSTKMVPLVLYKHGVFVEVYLFLAILS